MPPGQWSAKSMHQSSWPMHVLLCPVAATTAIVLPQTVATPSTQEHATKNRSMRRSTKHFAPSIKVVVRTTLILRKLPEDFSFASLLMMLEEHGFTGLYDFAYLPRNFKTSTSLGYAIVNFVSQERAEEALSRFAENNASYSDSHQGGLMMLIQRYRDSPMMHPDVPEEYKPAVFIGGHRVAFPPPSSSATTPESERITKMLCEQNL